MFSKVIECLEQTIWKQIDCKRPSSAKQMNVVQNICIEICKVKYNQLRLVLAVFASTKLALNYITLVGNYLQLVSKVR